MPVFQIITLLLLFITQVSFSLYDVEVFVQNKSLKIPPFLVPPVTLVSLKIFMMNPLPICDIPLFKNSSSSLHPSWLKFGNLVCETPTILRTQYDAVSPYQIGFHTITWGLIGEDPISITLEVSCSDGIICNGYERLTRKNSAAVCASPPKLLCNDLNRCTQDTCDTNGICTFGAISTKSTSPSLLTNCEDCKRSKCKPFCIREKRTCGWDGCFGECGPECPLGQLCHDGNCIHDDSRIGTCTHPYLLDSTAKLLNYDGITVRQVNTSTGFDVLAPRCDQKNQATEIIFQLNMPSISKFIGLEVRTKVNDLDVNSIGRTVISIIETEPMSTPLEACLKSTTVPESVYSCISSPDSFGPIEWGIPATWMLKPGRSYFIAVERHESSNSLKHESVSVRIALTPECVPLCANKECGNSGCPKVNCGLCSSGEQCLNGICMQQCTPLCDQSLESCGESDGCGGFCICLRDDQNLLDDEEEKNVLLKSETLLSTALRRGYKKLSTTLKKTRPSPVCDSLLPKCTFVRRGILFNGCDEREFCSVTCKCVSISSKFPDLVMMPFSATVDENVMFSSDSCSLDEGCVSGTGARRLLRFSTMVLNQGIVDFVLPSPSSDYPQYYEWAPCHGHYHLKKFLQFDLLDENGNIIVNGQKRSFCVADFRRPYPRPDAPCQPQYTCGKQGLSVGWSDTYDQSLDCQFLDITGVPPGEYIIKQCVNILRLFEEASYENNCATAFVRILETPIPPTGVPTISTTAPVSSQCAPSCPWSWVGDGYCDSDCNTQPCHFDGGDCRTRRCGNGCPISWLGDHYCDDICFTPECNYDNGDCDFRFNRPTAKPSTKRRLLLAFNESSNFT